ncbi:hypothetical protein ACFP81_02160 [Deinococcus lacus]|uniref:DUF2946 domain-containing protein n=1 Tax=Deinococcus lacus TaxID=392561 RepID=A0ABW1YBU4_9DEIO
MKRFGAQYALHRLKRGLGPWLAPLLAALGVLGGAAFQLRDSVALPAPAHHASHASHAHGAGHDPAPSDHQHGHCLFCVTQAFAAAPDLPCRLAAPPRDRPAAPLLPASALLLLVRHADARAPPFPAA